MGLFFLRNQFERETPPVAAASRIHLKSSVDSAQGSVGAANANQVYNHQHGREKREEKNNLPVLPSTHTHGHTDARTHLHKHTKGRRGWGAGGRARARERKCLQNAGWRLGARGLSARGKRAGSAARPERHDGGRGLEPIFWRGSCSDAIPRPRAWLRASSLLFLHLPFEAPRRFAPNTQRFLLLSDSCLLCPHAKLAWYAGVGRHRERRIYVETLHFRFCGI